jgi:hypothetical protein
LFQNKLRYIVERVPNAKHPNTFVSESTTGFTESEKTIWLHPPRADKFKFITQLAPYPEVRFPILIGDTIFGNIQMYSNWGDWTGHASEFYLTTLSDATLHFNSNMEPAYILCGYGTIKQDTACVTYVFSPKLGPVSGAYSNNQGKAFFMKMKHQVNH